MSLFGNSQLTTAFHSIASIGLYEKRLLATAAIPALLGVLLIGFVFGEWWQLGGYSWYFLPGTPLPQDPAVIYAATLYNPLAAVLLVGLATATANPDMIVRNLIYRC